MPDDAGRDHPAGVTTAPGIARIAVDLLGGDHAPAVVVDGALRACQADPSLHLLLAGPLSAARELLAALTPADRSRVRHLPAGAGPDGAGPTAARRAGARPAADSPAGARSAAARPGGADPGSDPGLSVRDPGSPITSAVRAVAGGHADALVSAGPTGATVTAAALGLGRQSGSRRPALAAVLPTATGRVVLLDVGASVDPDAATLVTHAHLGAAYAAIVHGLTAPRVGLLSIGTEDGKGDRLRRDAAGPLGATRLPAGARFVGLVEGHEAVLGDHADVVVADGFTGNVLLKSVEAAYALLGSPTRAGIPPRAALLLGIAGTCVVCHGAATADDVASGIALAARLHRHAIVSRLTALLAGDDAGRSHPSTSDHEVSP